MNNLKNIIFIDGQNLHLGVMEDNWKIDFNRLRIYLKDKYKIKHAYYFLGTINEKEQDLYDNLQKAGFIIKFKDHNKNLITQKKGNVDSDIIFEIMKNLLDNNSEFEKIFLISGDGDYIKIVDYLIKENRFGKILFPNRKFSSSLYKKLGTEYYDWIQNIKSYIIYKNKKGS